MNEKSRYLIVAAFLIIALFGVTIYQYWHGYSNLQEDRDILFQASTINTLFEGVYDGNMTYMELKKHGDVG